MGSAIKSSAMLVAELGWVAQLQAARGLLQDAGGCTAVAVVPAPRCVLSRAPVRGLPGKRTSTALHAATSVWCGAEGRHRAATSAVLRTSCRLAVQQVAGWETPLALKPQIRDGFNRGEPDMRQV